MRLFFASFLSADNGSAYEKLVAETAAETRGAIRPVPTASHHLTLAFLGEVADADVGTCKDILGEAGSLRAIPISLGPPRVLYARRTPRLVCVGLDRGAEAIAGLQTLLRDGLAERLPGLDVRPQPPHVTLARFRKSVDRPAARAVELALASRGRSMTATADSVARVHLVRSRLRPAGPVYERIAEWVLD